MVSPPVQTFAGKERDTQRIAQNMRHWADECKQIIENRKGGVGLSVGERLLTDEAAKLPLSALMEEKGCDNSCRKRLIELVRKCGLKERKDRPKIDEVLDEVTTLYDAVARDPGEVVRKRSGLTCLPS